MEIISNVAYTLIEFIFIYLALDYFKRAYYIYKKL